MGSTSAAESNEMEVWRGPLSDPGVLGLTRVGRRSKSAGGNPSACWLPYGHKAIISHSWGISTNHKATDPFDMGNKCLLPLSEEQGTC